MICRDLERILIFFKHAFTTSRVRIPGLKTLQRRERSVYIYNTLERTFIYFLADHTKVLQQQLLVW